METRNSLKFYRPGCYSHADEKYGQRSFTIISKKKKIVIKPFRKFVLKGDYLIHDHIIQQFSKS